MSPPVSVGALIGGGNAGQGDAPPAVLYTWTAPAPDGNGVITLPAWLRYQCATAGTTAQTGTSTLRTGFAANAPRGFRTSDSAPWAVLVEPQSTNLIPGSDSFAPDALVPGNWVGNWYGAAPAVDHGLPDPAGGLRAHREHLDLAGASEIYVFPQVRGHVSTWAKGVVRADPNKPYGMFMCATNNAGWHWEQIDVVTEPTWHKYEAHAQEQTATVQNWTMFHLGASFTEGRGDLGPNQIDAAYLMGEAGDGLSPFRRIGTSWIANGTTRAAGGMDFNGDFATAFPNRQFDLELRLTLPFANGETVEPLSIGRLANGNGDYRGMITPDGIVALSLAGQVIASAPLTWPRGANVTIRLISSADQRCIILSGFTTGNGIYQAAPTAAVNAIGNMALVGDTLAGGPQEPVGVVGITIRAPASSLPPAAKAVLVCDGNSITAGSGAGVGYPARIGGAEIARRIQVYNKGVQGRTLATQIAQAATEIDPLVAASIAAGKKTILVVWEAVNCINADGYTGAQIETGYRTYCEARKLANPAVKIIVVTGTPFYDSAPAHAEVNDFNTRLRSNWSDYADAIADVAADPDLGPPGCEVNQRWYVDTVHPTDFGQARLAQIIGAQVVSLL